MLHQGEDLLNKAQGLHNFMKWKHGLLTVSLYYLSILSIIIIILLYSFTKTCCHIKVNNPYIVQTFNPLLLFSTFFQLLHFSNLHFFFHPILLFHLTYSTSCPILTHFSNSNPFFLHPPYPLLLHLPHPPYPLFPHPFHPLPLQDSGGFQMVSLLKLTKVTEEGR